MLAPSPAAVAEKARHRDEMNGKALATGVSLLLEQKTAKGETDPEGSITFTFGELITTLTQNTKWSLGSHPRLLQFEDVFRNAGWSVTRNGNWEDRQKSWDDAGDNLSWTLKAN